MSISRRAALKGLGAGLGGVAIGCGSDDATTAKGTAVEPSSPPPAPSSSASPEPGRTGDPNPTDAGGTDPVLSPTQLLASVEHVIVLMMENRSFDHFMGSLGKDAAYPGKNVVEALKGTETNPAPDGGAPVQVFKLDTYTAADPPHSWIKVHDQFDNGKNDGFVIAHAGENQDQVMGYYERSQLPVYHWFADNFALCDHWFASCLGPTWPNRYYLHCTTSGGKKDNTGFAIGGPTTIWEALKTKNVSMKNYVAGIAPFYAGAFPSKLISLNPTATMNAFFDDAKNGKLPSFAIIDPDYDSSDDHPAHDVRRGQAFVASVYKALSESPQWSKTLLIVTYDEHGGFFDHVPPPTAVDDDPEFAHLGMRVPAFVIGPMVKKGYVSKVVREHSSVAATLRTRFGIQNLTTRMMSAVDISECIDPQKIAKPDAPPPGLPTVAMTMNDALTNGVGVSSQPELNAAVESGLIPAVNPIDHQERIGAWLGHAVRLGAVRIVG